MLCHPHREKWTFLVRNVLSQCPSSATSSRVPQSCPAAPVSSLSVPFQLGLCERWALLDQTGLARCEISSGSALLSRVLFSEPMSETKVKNFVFSLLFKKKFLKFLLGFLVKVWFVCFFLLFPFGFFYFFLVGCCNNNRW